jgi:UDP-2,4-diacetamido-2,4,6-trideoxy-beta-L-altropyranose hydrolase
MRCLTLAATLRERGASCTFVSRAHSGHSIDRIRADGFDVVVLPLDAAFGADGADSSQYASWLGSTWQNDAQQTLSAIGDAKADWLIVDHYALDSRWERELGPAASRIMVIDDLADRPHEACLLLDQNLVANLGSRYDSRLPESCGRLLGPRFALLQPPYAELHDRTHPRSGAIGRILTYFGGADSSNLTGRAVEAFLTLARPDVGLDVVLNANHPHAAAIQRLVSGHDNIVLHHNLPSLASLMATADLAIGAGGTTSWERCCLGLPALVVTLADNQLPLATELHRRGVIRWLGSEGGVDSGVIASALGELLREGLPRAWSEKCRGLVDGRGAERVCEYLLLSPATALHPRLASLADEGLLLDWANDPITRRNAFSAGQIDAATHHEWFLSRLNDAENCRLYIVETERGLPVGQVRFARADGGWELHYSIDPRTRGRKLARGFLGSAIAALRREQGNPLRLIARVRSENAISAAVLRSLGFRVSAEQGQTVEYEQLA